VIVVFIRRSYRRRARGGTPRALVEITTRTSLRLKLFPSIQITFRDHDDTDLMDVNDNPEHVSARRNVGQCSGQEFANRTRSVRTALPLLTEPLLFSRETYRTQTSAESLHPSPNGVPDFH
jgi:hypothetical protein